MLTLLNSTAFAAFAVIMASVVAGPAQAAEDAIPPPANAGAVPKSPGVPASTCRVGYSPVGTRLCLTSTRTPARSFANAELDCQDIRGRVADYADWRYRNQRGNGAGPPVGFWLGPITADNRALFVNQSNVGDFDGETSRFDLRFYACAHDLSSTP
jgi:hypothetical protein